MIAKLLNDIREGHYYRMRKRSSETDAMIAIFGFIFLILLVYYAALLIIIYGVLYQLNGTLVENNSFFKSKLFIFGCYIMIYFLLVNPKIRKGKISEETDGREKNRKMKTSLNFVIGAFLSILIAAFINRFIFGIL